MAVPDIFKVIDDIVNSIVESGRAPELFLAVHHLHLVLFDFDDLLEHLFDILCTCLVGHSYLPRFLLSH